MNNKNSCNFSILAYIKLNLICLLFYLFFFLSSFILFALRFKSNGVVFFFLNGGSASYCNSKSFTVGVLLAFFFLSNFFLISVCSWSTWNVVYYFSVYVKKKIQCALRVFVRFRISFVGQRCHFSDRISFWRLILHAIRRQSFSN